MTTLKAGVVAALLCAVFSVLLLLTVDFQESRAAQDRAIACYGNSTELVLAIGASLLITAIIVGWTAQI
jgi:ABC-type hemin transport system substrate-binding protein